MLKKNILLFIGIAFFVWAIWIFIHSSASNRPVIQTQTQNSLEQATIGNVAISIEIVTSDEARKQGLSGRESLAENTGMLFVFQQPAKYGFWMKDMLLPLDIIWIDENKMVIDIDKNVSPETYPQVFTPVSDAKYVLEMPANFSDVNKIEIGNSFSTDN